MPLPLPPGAGAPSTPATTSCSHQLSPGFLFPAVPGVHPHGRARAGCDTGGKQMSTPRLLILRRTLLCHLYNEVIRLDHGLPVSQGALRDAPGSANRDTSKPWTDYFILLYMKFRVTFCLSKGSHCSETSMKTT